MRYKSLTDFSRFMSVLLSPSGGELLMRYVGSIGRGRIRQKEKKPNNRRVYKDENDEKLFMKMFKVLSSACSNDLYGGKSMAEIYVMQV